MNKLENPNCDKCGEEMRLNFVPSSGMDIEPTGMFAECKRCGYRKKINSLDEKIINKILKSNPLL